MTQQPQHNAPLPPLHAEADRFVDRLRTFRQSLETEMKSQDRRIADQNRRLSALETTSLDRSALASTDPASPHQKALADYLRTGDEAPLKDLSIETKALSTAVAADGGYLVDPRTAETVATVLRGGGSIRSRASVVTVEAGSYDVLIDHGDFGAGWTAETGSAAETSTPAIDRISIALHELSALPKASQRLLDDAAFDLETWLAERIADRFGRAESAAFISGDGVDKPKGILAHTTVDNASWTWGSLGSVKTGTSGAFAASDPADALIDLIYALGAEYRGNASFVMNSTTAGIVRKFKDNEGRYLWTEPMGEGESPRLFGYPVLIVEEMPDIAADATAVAFGDFRAGYTIAERPDLRVLRDPFSAKPHVLFYATKRVGGDVTDFAAIKLLSFSA
ncbi:MAG: phage major capsid protein [Pseudomonadota bacterium]